ncbi:hypothetical protein VTK26DRAFT_5038 [Humicola hyalothermophila]
MAVNKIDGPEELYVGGVFGVNRGRLIQEHKITHILSVIKYSLNRDDNAFRDVQHLSIDIDDMEDQDILVHLPKMVRFIDAGLKGDTSPGAVLVHCAMGKSRSVSAVIAYLLWKHPGRYGKSNPRTTGRDAVGSALQWVRRTRPIAEPNDGFMRQLEMWWVMGCPADSDDAVEKDAAYQRWLYKREVEDAARVGRAPDRIRFEDEETAQAKTERGADGNGADSTELRCKKCRRVLATDSFIVPHHGRGNAGRADCPHFFVEALSWMRPVLEQGELDGRLVCPNAKCAASIGRYAWQGFKCSCGDWVAPAFSLQQSKVDKVSTAPRRTGDAGAIPDRMVSLGIRLPPGHVARSSPSLAIHSLDQEKARENL